MLRENRVLVVGTTSDYIHWIRRECPGRVLFLTESKIRRQAAEETPLPEEEILCNVTSTDSNGDLETVKKTLGSHLDHWGQKISGVVCFDCESMETAAMLAAHFSLDYPGLEAIQNSRDKYISKQIWQKHGVPCPRSKPVNSLADILEFLREIKTGLVLKPFFGSGSELVFRCTTQEECEQGYHTIKEGLAQRSLRPLFMKKSSHDHAMLAEELIEGMEFSCDFMVEDESVSIIRMTRKVHAPSAPFGSILGYVIPGSLPEGTHQIQLAQTLLKGAQALGIQRGICMVDFRVKEDVPVLIEMTPRPGGDCLPFLLLESGNLDILRLALDFAEKKPGMMDTSFEFTPHMGIRVLAPQGGVLKKIDPQGLTPDPRIKKMHFIRKPGHIITMPPEDYDSWLLGHMIVQADPDATAEAQCLELCQKLVVEVELP